MIEVPKHLRGRPTYGGFVVPYFVAWYRGSEQVDEREQGAKPDFKVTDYRRLTICRKQGHCWICGKHLGAFKWFVFGPGSALSRCSIEPPSHRECAHYAVQICPFMLDVTKDYRHPDLKPGQTLIEGVAYRPEVTVLWATKGYKAEVLDATRGVWQFIPGDPEVVEFWYEGRKATRAEIERAITKVLEESKYTRSSHDMAWRIKQLMEFAPEASDA